MSERYDGIVRFVREHWRKKGYGPSLDEIARSAGYSHRPAALYAVQHLRDEGRLTWGVNDNGRMIRGTISVAGERCPTCGMIR